MDAPSLPLPLPPQPSLLPLPPQPSLPPPTETPLNMPPRSFRRAIEISSSQVLVEILDSALKELEIAKGELDVKEEIKAANWTSSPPPRSWSGPPRYWCFPGDDYQTPEYHEARLAVYSAEERVAWCEKKVEIAVEIAINPPPKFHGYPLISASCSGNVEVVLAILGAGQAVNVNACTSYGMTALAYAAQGPMPDFENDTDKYVAIVKALLKAGADVHIRDNKDKTALSRAISCEQTEIVNLLRAHGAY